jgi:magnesium transporter
MNGKNGKERMIYADDDRYSVRVLASMRVPILLLGLVLGIVMSMVTSRFEEVLSQNVAIVFFLPFLVYMADAIGAQTRDIYVRDLKSGRASFRTYAIKETVLGVMLGVLFGAVSFGLVGVWFGFGPLAAAVGLAMFAAVAVAPFLSLLTVEIFQLEHKDPAVEAGPVATVILDTITVLIYGLISSAILL